MAAAVPTETTERLEKTEMPQVFGRYLLLKRLSRGGMGEIFLGKLGEIQGFEKPVIIKKILPQLSADDEFVRRFIDEAQVAIKLTHANIAPVYEVGKVDGDYFLALEYVEGRDLRRLMARFHEERRRLPPDLCLYIVRELANGLGYAHRRTDPSGQHLSLVHCDISPPNVMVSFEGEVKVIDFGIAKSAIRIAGSNPNIGFGKFGYMAPEQLLKGGVVDRRTDIYAAGVVLYELLTGERLFQFPEGADYRQIARIVTKGEFTPPSVRTPGLDPSLDPIVGKALASKAADRYQTAEEFRDAIQSKLSQMNPTISADALAHLMKGLFADEIVEERALVTSTRQVDVGAFKEQLDGSMNHTVTFARAGMPGRRASGVVRSVSAPPGAPRRDTRRAWIIGVGSTAVVLAMGLVSFVVLTHPAAPSRALPPTPPPEVRKVVPHPPPTVPAKPVVAPVQPVITVTPLGPPIQPRTATRKGHPDPRSTRVARADDKLPGTADPVEPAIETPPPPPKRSFSDEQVQAKFRTVNVEYDSFKSEYGARLEAEYNAIVREITFGNPREKYVRVNAMLDSLRRDMQKVRTGG